MRLVRVKKRVFKREFLEFQLVVVVFDIYEMNQEEEETEININKVFYVFPMVKGAHFNDQEVEKLL